MAVDVRPRHSGWVDIAIILHTADSATVAPPATSSLSGSTYNTWSRQPLVSTEIHHHRLFRASVERTIADLLAPLIFNLFMCLHEIVGDYWTGCGHFHGRYFTGITTDCGSPRCKTSASHMHKTAPNCGCPSVVTEDRRVQNLYRTPHSDCAQQSR